jgi:hypothetical protein
MLRVDGGGSGIRTHGSLRIPGFQDRCFKPLSHPSSFGFQILSTLRSDPEPGNQLPALASQPQILENMRMTGHGAPEHCEYIRIRAIAATIITSMGSRSTASEAFAPARRTNSRVFSCSSLIETERLPLFIM